MRPCFSQLRSHFGHRRFHRGLLLSIRDAYATLGVPTDASQEEIKRAFREKAKQCHPDVNADDPKARDRFNAINHAYEAIGEESTRRAYDLKAGRGFAGGSHEWSAGVDPQYKPKRRAWSGTGFEAFGMGFEAFMKQTMGAEPEGGMGAQARAGQEKPLQQGTASQTDVRLTFREAAKGCRKEVDFSLHRVVHGHEEVSTERVWVAIPAGIQQGEILRVDHKRDPLFVRVQVEEDEVLLRQGTDLHMVFPLRISQAILGATVHVPTLDGDVTVEVPPGTQHGDMQHIKGHGIRDVNGAAMGDQVVHFIVEIPSTITPDQREQMIRFSQDEPTYIPGLAALGDLKRRWRVLFTM